MDATERELFATGLRHATGSSTGAALDAALDELGWPEALAADARAAVSLLFEHQGATNATSSALDRVVLAALGLDAARGAEAAALVLPALGPGGPPGALEGGSLAVRGLGAGALGRREVAVVVASGGADGTVAVTVPTGDLTLRSVRGFDPALGLHEVTADHVPAAPRGTAAAPGVPWAAGVAAGRRALAHELVGTARAMLRLAREHALDRVQFGRPIGSFQAIRHRLADTLVAIEAADAALQAAWDDPSPVNAASAKALAGRGALVAARHCQQVLAGIGFTTEHPLHRHVRRARVLDQLLGNARALTRQLGEDVLATHRLPALLPL
jgi:hypothetical protein